MERTKEAFLGLVRAARTAKKLDEELTNLGYAETPYAEIYSNIADAIYRLLNESTEKFEDSVTHTMLTAPLFDNERRAACLNYVYTTRNAIPTEQPSPEIAKPELMKQLYERSGGYMSPEGDWT